MRFKQYLKEANVTQEEWAKFVEENNVHSLGVAYKTPVEFKDGVITNGVNDSHIRVASTRIGHGGTPVEFKCPFTSDQWNVDMVNLEVYDIKNFGMMPNVPRLVLANCVIESFKGGSHLTKLKRLSINDYSKRQKPIGVLSLLKLPALIDVDFTNGTFGLEDDELRRFNNLIDELIRNKADIIEAQSTLIDAGFEEFAKL